MKDYFSWEYYAMDKIQELANEDPDYQQVKQELEGAYSRYIELISTLPSQQQEILMDYECGCANLRHIETMIAYELGRRTPRILTVSAEHEKNSCNWEQSVL